MQNDVLVPSSGLVSQAFVSAGWRVVAFHPQVVYVSPVESAYSDRFVDVHLSRRDDSLLPVPEFITFGQVSVKIYRVDAKRYVFHLNGIMPGDTS